MTSLRLITPPADLPATLGEVKTFLRVDHDEDDAGISAMLAAAVNLLDGRNGILGRCLEPQTWELLLDRFPEAEIRLPLGPVASVTSVAYTDPDGAEHTMAAEGYILDNAEGFGGWIVPTTVTLWPATLPAVNAVRVRFVAGTGTPDAIKQSLLAMVAERYDGRTGKLLTPGIVADLAPFRRPVVA